MVKSSFCHMSAGRRGLTLVELLITTSIVGIIMTGMVSIDYALRTNEQQQTRVALVSLRTSAIMEDLVTNARQAFGDVATQCIQMANLTSDNTNYICMYRELNTPVTPSDLSDDSWVCYTRHGTNFHKCTYDVADGPTNCPAASATIIGTVTTDVFAAPDTPVMVSTPPDFYFQVTVKNRYDPTVSGADTYAATPANEYRTNPKFIQTSHVSPAGCVP